MFKNVFRFGLIAGASVSVLALSSAGVAAEELETVVEIIDEIVVDDDMIAWSGEVVDEIVVDDGAELISDDDMIAWSGEIVEDPVVIEAEYTGEDPASGGEAEPGYEQEEPVPVDSECDGCEYWTTDLDGGPRVLERAVTVTAQSDGWDSGSDVDPFARGNVCFSEATYVAILCDWQRPFLGDMMPAQ
jgi:hypothetical protein